MKPPQTMVLPLRWRTVLFASRNHKPQLEAEVSPRYVRLAFGDLANLDGAFEVPVTVTIERGRIVIERTGERRGD